jgi:mandelate racemase
MTYPKIREFRVRAVRVPMAQPHRTASGTISESPLVLTDIFADNGTVGHSMIFTYAVAALKPTADLIKNLESFVKDEPLAPAEIADKFAKRFRLLGLQGLIAMAVAAIDMALWDALARSHNTSLVRLLGATEKPIPAYGAVGYDGVAGSAQGPIILHAHRYQVMH